MRANILHITNGDNTTDYLKSLKFEGDFITWREMLCEGKTSNDVGSESFWKTRFDFLKKNYKVSKKAFINFTLKEYRALCQHKNKREIILWFEYDLFCQINMIAVISWIKRYRPQEHISLVCSGDVEGNDKKLGLGKLSEDQILQHYENRMELSQDDIEYADYVWQLYCSDSHLRLDTTKLFNPAHKFIYLDDALELHLQRFPSLENGLNIVENHILQTAHDTNPKSRNDLITNILKRDFQFGYGDLQYLHRIDRLKTFFTSLHPVKLSRKGKQALNRQISFYQSMRDENAFLGGSKKYSYLFNNQTNKLLKITY